jgi:hypothetical protein
MREGPFCAKRASMDPSSFLQGMTRETSIRRDAEGRWFFDGEPLDHPNLTKAFDRWIERAEDGRYCLKNDINWAYFQLEGAPYFVERVRKGAQGGPELELSNDSVQPLAADSLRYGPEGALYCDVKGDMVARFSRHAATQLEPWLSEDDQGVYLELDGKRVRPQMTSDPLEERS